MENSHIVSRLAAATAQLTAPGAPFEITTSDDGLRRYRQAPTSMRALIDQGRQFADNDFLVFGDQRRDFAAFFTRVDALAHQLVHSLGVKAGDRIAIAMRNYPEWMEIYAAVVSLGAIVVPLNSWGKARELHFGLEDSGAVLVFCDQARYDFVADTLPTLGCRAVLTRADSVDTDHPAVASDYEALLAPALGKAMPEPLNEGGDNIVQIMYTSGTTGTPKGAVSSHDNIIQAIVNFEFHATCSAIANPSAVEDMINAGLAPCTLLAVPLFHVSGCYAAFLLNLRGGRKIVMMHKWDVARAIALIAEENVTIFSAAPTMVEALLQHPDFAQANTASLYSLGGGGAACPPSFKQAIEQHRPRAYVGTGYGMTESNATCANCTGDAYRYKPTSAGTLSPIVEFQTRDDRGQSLPDGESGEIWLRSPTNVQGYWQRARANEELFQDGWMSTGDIGYIDEEQFVFVVGRSKDLIIRGGENIYPAEIESCLSELPAVRECAVIALDDAHYGQIPGLVLRLKEGNALSTDDIQHFLGDRLAKFKVPQRIWFHREPLPRNPAGKVLKPELEALYAG